MSGMAVGLVQETDVRLPQGNLRQSKLDRSKVLEKQGRRQLDCLLKKNNFKALHFSQMSYLGGRLVQTKDYFQPDPPVGW